RPQYFDVGGKSNAVYREMIAAYEKGDAHALAEALALASTADLMLFKADLPPGKTLAGVLEDLRTKDPEGHAKVLDAFTDPVSAQYDELGGEEGSKIFRDALTEHLRTTADPAVVRAYAERNLGRPALLHHFSTDPQRAAADVL